MIRINHLKAEFDFSAVEAFGALLNARLKLGEGAAELSVNSVLSKEKLSWIVCSSDAGRFALGLSNSRRRFICYSELLNILSSEFNKSFMLESDIFVPELFEQFSAYSFEIDSESGFIVLWSKSLPDLVLQNKADFMLDLEIFAEYTNGASSLSSFYTDFNGFRYSFSFDNRFSFFECMEKSFMENDIAAVLKIGSLQIKLSDLIELRPGSKIGFELPESTEVFLEIGNRVFAKGVMSKGQAGTVVVDLTEIGEASTGTAGLLPGGPS